MSMILLALIGGLAHAEDSEFEGTDDAGQVFDETDSDLSVELGGAAAAGNTQFWTVNGLAAGAHRWKRNKLSLELGANAGRGLVDGDGDGFLSDAERNAGMQETARRFWAEGRYDRFVGNKDALYGLAGAFVDPFAGYDLRSHEQLGYSRLLVNEDDTHLVGEIGIDLAQENYVEGVDPNYADILAARVMLGFDHAFNENLGFSERVEAYENLRDFEDLRVLNDLAFTAKVSNTFSLKLSHQLIFDNVPVEGFRKTDHTVLATLVASIL